MFLSRHPMPWLYLAAAIVFELCGTTSLKLAAGFTRPLPSVLICVFYAASFTSLAFAIRTIPLGTAYAIWSGVGTAALLPVAWWLFGEAMSASKLAAVGLIIMGVVWLRLAEPAPAATPPPEQVRHDR